MKRSNRFIASVVILIAVSAAGFEVGRHIKSPAQVQAETAPPEPSQILARVRNGRLRNVGEAQGKLAWPGLATIGLYAGTLPAVPLVTSEGSEVGNLLDAADTLMTIADEPVFLLQGAVPLYRDLSIGDLGDDVARFQTAMREAGYGITDTPGVFGVSTELAVERLYADSGFTAPITESSQAEPKHGKDRSTSTVVVQPHDFIFVQSLPVRLIDYKVGVGQPVSGDLATIAAGAPEVQANVSAAVADSFKVGARVLVRLSGKKPIPSVIVKRGTATESSTNGIQYPITVRSSRPLPASSVGAAATVVLPADGSEKGLIVPISGIYETGNEPYVVRVRDGQNERVTVTISSSSGGRAVVLPPNIRDLASGDQIVVGGDVQ